MLNPKVKPNIICGIAWVLSACTNAANTTPPPPAPTPTVEAAESETDLVVALPPSVKPELEQDEAPLDAPVLPEQIDVSEFPATLSTCPRMTVSNAPGTDAERAILDYRPIAGVNGVKLAVAPVEAGCLSSGFGLRDGRRHKGIDLYNADPVNVFAAANGRIRERVYRDDYGNSLVIEHGDGVFTRYAHLERFAPGIEIGASVTRGQTVGVMGNTASYPIPRHLHYEILLGTYGTLTGSFGLTPVDIFDYLP